jgi:hypothetical protein
VDLGNGVYRVKAVVQNEGWMSTNLTQQAIDLGIAKPVSVKVGLPQGAELLSGREVTDVGHLEGKWATSGGMFGARPAADRKTLEWLVRTPEGGKVTVRARSQKGGNHTAVVSLG